MKKIEILLSVATLIILALVIFLSYYLQPSQVSMDLGREITLGKIIVTTGNIPNINLFSYTQPNFQFVDAIWLSTVIFYSISNTIGLDKLLIFASILGLISYAIAYLTAFKLTKLGFSKIYILNILFTIYYYLSINRGYIRPELFSFFLLSIFIYVLYKYRENYTKLIFILIPLEILWVNLHIYFIIGEIVVFIFLLEAIWNKGRNNLKSFLEVKENKILSIVFWGTILATLFNPYFIKGALYPITYSSNYGSAVLENLNLVQILQHFQSFQIYFFLIIIFCLFTVIYLNKNNKFLNFALAIVFIILPFYAIRNLPLFVFGTFAIFATSLTNLNFLVLKKKSFGLLLIIFIILIINLEKVIFFENVSFNSIDENQKKTAMDFFINNKIKGPILNDMNIGSYIIYKLYPKEKVFVDERPEAYSKDFLTNEYFLMQNDYSVFNNIVKKYKFNSIILLYPYEIYAFPTNSFFYLTTNLINDNKWKPIYLNGKVVIFIKNTPENKNLIDKYYLYSHNGYSVTDTQVTADNLAALINIFDAWGWTNYEIEISKKILNLDPNNCNTLLKLGELYKNNNRNNEYILRYRKTCGFVSL